MDHHQRAANKALWNARVAHHVASKLYDVDAFVAGAEVLGRIELELLGELRGQELLHLQCHFGQDTLALARHGARVTGLDFSEAALAEAERLAQRCGLEATWVLSDVTEERPELVGRFDRVFSSYGTIGWLPDLQPWARNVARYLRTGGRFVFVEFHPAVWMFDNDFRHIAYSYFNRAVIAETEQGTYADTSAPIALPSYSWNHDLGEVIGALLNEGLRLTHFSEHDGSPYNVFPRMERGSDGLYRITELAGKLPMVYALCLVKDP